MKKKAGCEGCKITEKAKKGGVVDVDQDWLFNQYWGGEGYLGWLALQPKQHIMSMDELEDSDAREMGSVIRRVVKALKKYWAAEWKGDTLQRVYVNYFFDSVFDNNPTDYHLHIHLIPRTKRLRPLIVRDGRINCWEIYKVSKSDGFPEDYVRHLDRVEKLMKGLSQLVDGGAYRAWTP